MSSFQRIYWSKTFDWKQYAKVYERYCRTKNNYYEQSARVLIRAARLKPNDRIIDLACGTGALSKVLLRRNRRLEILAVDLSCDMLRFYHAQFARQIKTGQIRMVEGNAEKVYQYTNGQYDVVFIASALWDVEIPALFKSLARVVKKNGLVVFNLPALVVGKEQGFIFFIEHFFRQALGSVTAYRRIRLDALTAVMKKNHFILAKTNPYSFRMSKNNVAQFYDLLRYRYPFILFPKTMPYAERLKKCTAIFRDSLRYIPKDGIREKGFVFVLNKI